MNALNQLVQSIGHELIFRDLIQANVHERTLQAVGQALALLSKLQDVLLLDERVLDEHEDYRQALERQLVVLLEVREQRFLQTLSDVFEGFGIRIYTKTAVGHKIGCSK